jgi:hypothetical protein
MKPASVLSSAESVGTAGAGGHVSSASGILIGGVVELVGY